MKIKNLLKSSVEISLPIITDCAIGFSCPRKITKTKIKYVESTFYQSTKMICYSTNKPLYLINENDK